MIRYVRGDATQPICKPAIITHICNDFGGWGSGFVVAISRRWRQPESVYRLKYQQARSENSLLRLGDVQFVDVDDEIVVANLIGQHKYITVSSNEKPIRYEAVREGLFTVARQAEQTGYSIHMPRIGCGLAGGSWDRIEPMIEECCDGISVFVYDLPSVT